MTRRCVSTGRARLDCSSALSNTADSDAGHRHPSMRLASTPSRLLAPLGPGVAGLTVLTASPASLRWAFADGTAGPRRRPTRLNFERDLLGVAR